MDIRDPFERVSEFDNDSRKSIDEIDRKILMILKRDARKTYAEIGQEIGVVRQTVKNRVDNLEARGIIKGYTTIVDSTNDSEAFMFFMDIEVNPEYFEDVVEGLKREKYIKRLYQMTGPCRLHAIGIAASPRNLKLYVDNMRHRLMGIKYITYSIAMSTLINDDARVDNEIRCEESEHLEGGKS